MSLIVTIEIGRSLNVMVNDCSTVFESWPQALLFKSPDQPIT
jgi:hypothetical protein